MMTETNLDTLRGVYFPCLQSILGVILFLRLTHITSQAGCLFTTLLILISSASTLFTWSSLSAIVTNGQIQGSSGPYYIISRTLGADIGCSLGLLYYIGSTLSCSMFVLGAVEAAQHSIRAYYARWGYGFSGHVFKYDVQIMALVLVVSMAGCVHVGTKYVTLFSNVFICVTLSSILCMTVGCALFAMGLDEGNLQPYDRSFMENVWPRYEPDPYTGVTPNFFSCLALIYPCVTGMLAGMSKSAFLKTPSQSIPKGTFWAIITSTLVYLTVSWLFGMTISNRTLKVDKFVTASVSFPHEMIVRVGVIVSCFGLILGCLSTAPNLIAAMGGDNVLSFLALLRKDDEDSPPIKALWFTALLVALPTLGGNLDRVSPYATIFYLLMYAGINMSTCISGFVRPPGFRPTFRYFHWSVSFVGFIWCLGLGFCISVVGTFVSMLALLLMHGYIKKARRLAKSGIKWGTLGSAVRYNIVSSALNSLAKSAATASTDSYPSEVILSMSEEGRGMGRSPSFLSDGSVVSPLESKGEEEWVHFQPNNPDFHAKNWRPQLLTIMPVDYNGRPINLHVMSLAAQLQQTGRGINVVISILDRSQVGRSDLVASAIDSICAEANVPDEDASVISEMTGATNFAPAQSPKTDRWRNEDLTETSSLTRSGIDHSDTIQLMQRSKALLMLQMKKEGMDGFAEVSTTDGKFFEAVWSAVIHTGLGPLSPNTILLSLPSFLAFDEENASRKNNLNENSRGRKSIAFEQDITRAEEYLRTINGILNLGKAVILFKGCQTYPTKGVLLPERGTIDIWWIVHDGGLLLLLPYLLSKHSVWTNVVDDGSTKKQKKRLAKLGAKLRLFAVTTTREEDPERLRDVIASHLDAIRIHAEVQVVDCMAGTNIAGFFRDDELANGSLDDASSILKREMGRQSSNPVASLRNDGISTHHMTLGEVFASKSCKDPSSQVEEKPDPSLSCQNDTQPTDNDSTDAASKLNEAMRKYSSGANLVVANLPFIHKQQTQCPHTYFQFVGKAFEGIDNLMLVRGSGTEVVTAYA